MTSEPAAWAETKASTSAPICPTLAPLTDDEPTLTTMRRARGISARTVGLLVTILCLIVALNSETFVVAPHAGFAL